MARERRSSPVIGRSSLQLLTEALAFLGVHLHPSLGRS